MKKINGFSLLEILVVLAIISMLLSFVIFMIGTSKAKSRDARREQDIKQLQNALSLYVNNSGSFPCAGGAEVIINGSTDCLSSALISSGAIAGTPTDPLHGSTGVCGEASSYVYCYEATDNGFNYQLRYNLETDNILGKSAGWQTALP